jgi:16S rRNA A1518/A1519 N6-dimethyltransferase RsmA/KsgA/DIM1 with predicted DNA glycosylase/AP lyase activity
MLKNALMHSDLGLEQRRLLAALKAASIDGRRRAETISVEEFVTLANLLQ